jgi:hypothetical protein
MNAALERLKRLHKAPVPNALPTADTLAKENAALGPSIEAATSRNTGQTLGNLLAATKTIAGSTEDATAAYLKDREEKGIYTVPDAAYALEGLEADKLLEQLRELDAATIEKTPEIPRLGVAIRKNLEQYPELTHILSEDQLGIIVSGYLVHAGVETAPKGKAAKSKAANVKIETLGKLRIDELF